MAASSKTSSFNLQGATIEQLNKMSVNTMLENIGIEFTEIGDGYISATMPVDNRTHQPLGLLHGGASVALAETLGSVGATLFIDQKVQYCVGLEINANHIKSARDGKVKGTARPVHIGKRTHVWEIKITNMEDDLISVSRITMAIIDKR